MILVYHHILPPQLVPSNPDLSEGWKFTISPEGFRGHIKNLSRRGYRFVSLESLLSAIYTTGKEPENVAVITFDDGWVDNYVYAYPVLRELNIPATFFLTTGHFRRGEADSRKMNPDQIGEMLRGGMSIGGHTRNHAILTLVPSEVLNEEVIKCKDDLEKAFGIAVTQFAYPGGAFNRRVAWAVRAAGYTSACSVLGPMVNNEMSRYWLYRDILSESMKSWSDIYRLSPTIRRLLSFRVRRRLNAYLGR